MSSIQENYENLSVDHQCTIGGLAVLIFCIVFIYSSTKINHYLDGDLNSRNIASYVQGGQDTTIDDVKTDLANCVDHSDNWFFEDCDELNEDLIFSLIDKAIIQRDLDALWVGGLDPMTKHSSRINDHINRNKKLLDYDGGIARFQYYKAIELVREKQTAQAYSILIGLLKSDYVTESAELIRGMFKFYGCETEHEIWGELATRTQNFSVIIGGNPYPPQKTAGSDYIIDKRMELARGETNIIQQSCPVHTLLSK
ncbi:MAG: hypothetical protein EOO52_13415 [Gammaproteobacteria bacterium]|nr:MAG: hypothetical protein EOO52_13415 [Gammaproteobacteria bacterium]